MDDEADPTAGRTDRRGWRRLLAWVWVLWVVFAVLVLTPLLSTSQHTIGPGVVRISMAPGWSGSTTLAVPPLGTVSADTHRGPSHVTAELRELDVQPLLADGGRVDVDTLTAAVRTDLGGAVRSAALRIALVGALVGAVAVLVLPNRRVWRVAAGAALGCVVATGVAAGTLVGYDPTRFEEPTYEGPIAASGSILAAITTGDRSGLDARLDVLAARVADLYSANVTAEVAESAGDVAILHVSDIHLNPVGVAVTRQLAQAFDVDAILDTGDTTSFGLPVEEPFAELLDDFEVPYLFVAGNHDSPANRRAIAAAPGVTAIGGEVVDVGGVRILGFDDPVVTATRTVSREERERIMEDAAPELESLVRRLRPDVVATHNPAMASVVAGAVPVVVAGHLHRSVLSAEDGTVVAVAGSTGATGLGSLVVQADLPYEAQVLRFLRGRLVAVDVIELRGTRGDFVVRRQLVTDELRGADPDPVLSSDPDEQDAATDPDGTDPDGTDPDGTDPGG